MPTILNCQNVRLIRSAQICRDQDLMRSVWWCQNVNQIVIFHNIRRHVFIRVCRLSCHINCVLIFSILSVWSGWLSLLGSALETWIESTRKSSKTLNIHCFVLKSGLSRIARFYRLWFPIGPNTTFLLQKAEYMSFVAKCQNKIFYRK